MNVEYLKKLQSSPDLQNIEWALCNDKQTGFYYWLTHWAYTLDSHDKENPIKLFPEKEYIKIISDILLKENKILVPKTRQMMLSWLVVAFCLWYAQYHRGQLIFFQSKKEEDADDLVKRAKFIYDHEPKFLKRFKLNNVFYDLKANPQNKGQHTFCKLAFPDNYSEIRGIPQGGDVIRMHTASILFSDEMGFQPEASDAFTAAKPGLSSGGKFIGVSTAEDNSFFDDMVYDRLEVL